jgi:AraC family transcriptional regulator
MLMQRNMPGGQRPITPDERLDFLPYRPAATSGPLGWSGLRVEHFQGKPDRAFSLPPLTHHLLLLYRRPPGQFALRCKDLDRQESPAPGSILVIPAGSPTCWRWRGRCESYQVQLEPRLLARVAAQEFDLDPKRVTLPPVNDLSHPPIQSAIRSLQAEVASGGAGGRLLAESLGNVLAVHLLRHFVAPGKGGPPPAGGLPKRKLQTVVEYIHEHLDAALTLDHLARVAHLSPYHFARRFKKSTGLPPHQYVIARRVERAKELLRDDGDLPLAEVAAAVGFWDQGHFTRHFKRLVGVTPGRFL